MQTHEWEELLHEAPEDHLPGKRAVVEVIRLRKAIAAIRDRYLARAAVAPAAPVFNDLVDVLTRILEGDSSE